MNPRATPSAGNPNQAVDEYFRVRVAKRLAATVQSRMAGTGVTRVMEKAMKPHW